LVLAEEEKRKRKRKRNRREEKREEKKRGDVNQSRAKKRVTHSTNSTNSTTTTTTTECTHTETGFTEKLYERNSQSFFWKLVWYLKLKI